jgi:hypothetical protein
MNDSHANWMVSGGWASRALLAGVLLLATLVGSGCCVFRPPVACVNIEATVAYYYRYNDANPDLSDIAFIEVLPPGVPRCIIGSANRAPVFPGSAISGLKIDGRIAQGPAQIQDKATIAVYYKGEFKATGSFDESSKVLVAVESLWGISRVIESTSAVPGGGCGPLCRSVPCDGYTCCKCP